MRPHDHQDQPPRPPPAQPQAPVILSPSGEVVSSSTVSDELQQLKDEVTRAKDQYLRLLADVENTKKRVAREKEEFLRYAAEGMVRRLLPIMDSFTHALTTSTTQPDAKALLQGVQLIHRQLLDLLEKEGVKRIEALGVMFDPHLHEAVAQVDAPEGTADGAVVEEVQVGYTMHGTVIRPAMVKIAKRTRPETGDMRPQT